MELLIDILKRKSRIERDFRKLKSGAELKVVPRLPDRLDINIIRGNIHKSKTIHVNEISHVRDTIKLHGWI